MVSGVFFRHIICALKIAIFFFPFTLSMMKRAVESTLQRRNEAKKINTSSVKGENGKLLFFCWMQARAPVCCFFFIECISNDDIFARRLRSLMLFHWLQTRAPVVTSWSAVAVSCCYFSNDDIYARRLRSLSLFLWLQTRAPVVTSWSDDWSERALFIFVCRSYVDPEDRLSWQGRPFFYVRWNHQDEFFIKRFDQDFPWGPSKVCSYRLV